MKRLAWLVVCAASIWVRGAEASAQALAPAVYVSYGSTRLASADTFNTIAGSSAKTGIGFGGKVDALWRGLFVDAAFSQYKLDGERVFISGGDVFPLGIPATVTYRPVDIAGGWGFSAKQVRPYIGGGVSIVSYRETSDFSQPADDVDERKAGALLLAGLDVAVFRHVRVGGELRYRTITGVLGTGGVSELFSETDLGGASFALRVSVGR